MKAVRIDKSDEGVRVSFGDFDESELMEGSLVVAVSHSSLNYKDGLAITGKAPVVRRYPMIPGVDLAGVVESSSDPRFKPGDEVVATGCGLGEVHLGGYAQRARLPADWALLLPEGLSARNAMAIGTAGLTAALCLLALEDFGLAPDMGPFVVTGAAGGVGSVATALAARAGWRVIAATGRPDEEAYLRELGAHDVIERKALSEPGRPLAKERWAAGVDVAGSHTLANVLAQTRYGGAIAACGLAQGMDLPTTVAPFILRGVALLGVDSVAAPQDLRRRAWERLARDLDLRKLEAMTRTVPLAHIIGEAPNILEGRVRGRTVVEIE